MYDDIVTIGGSPVYSNEYIETLRREKAKKAMIAQRGCQEKFLSSGANITFFGGNRGGGKTVGLLMECLKDIFNPQFHALVLRNEKEDLAGVIAESYNIYGQFGSYNRSKDDMTWNFKNGGWLKFSFYSDDLESFKKRFQGKQYSYIAMDEITHSDYSKFKYILTDNRNGYGIRTRFYGTCNPDPDSWVAKFIEWWIDEDGFPIPERDGVLRYCFMDGDTPDTIYWGDSPEEVYKQCKSIIDPLWKDEYEEMGFDKMTMFVKSVTFIKGKLEENLALIANDPNYVANLAQQSEEQRARDLEGNWKWKTIGDDLIKMADMERFYGNAQIQGGKRYASCDVAFSGGDSLVMWLWIGWHIEDVFCCKLDAKGSVDAVKAKLDEWGVLEQNFTYDENGCGQAFKGFFRHAVPFNNIGAVEEKYKPVYDNIKSQAAYLFAMKLIDGEMSINPRLLMRKFSGKGYEKQTLRQILMKERKCIRGDESRSDRGFCLIRKPEMKRILGNHRSPDFIEALFMRMIFEIKKVGHSVRGLPRFCPNPTMPRSRVRRGNFVSGMRRF